MRVPFGKYIVAFLTISVGFSNAIPMGEPLKFNQRSTNSTNEIFTEQGIKDGAAGDAALKGINFSIFKGGTKWMRYTFTSAITVTGLIFQIITYVKMSSNNNSCEPVQGSQFSDDGEQGINWYYYVTTSGANCDTTAESKTITEAIEKAWQEVSDRKYDYSCINLSHGGTWHGHLAIATKMSGVDVKNLCY
ncbi:hypothetical protein BDW59DRAFT_158265 [Aspergillus cavernicola]|uniref:Secreted protein CSS2 C-terminal domain-containing protein n=1 Tax=Aspergillus cavernicola TaxID=176166 RepID=A0ABR4IST0_9EURO